MKDKLLYTSCRFIKVSLSPLIGVIVGSFLTYHFGIKGQLQIQRHENRQRVYAKLMGLNYKNLQLYNSYFNAILNSDYFERRYVFLGQNENSFDFKEAYRWMIKSEELNLEISNHNVQLFETLGLIKVLFNRTDEMDSLIENIYTIKIPKRFIPPDKLNIKQLSFWKDSVLTGFHGASILIYKKPIDDLLSYLNGDIKYNKT